MVAVTPTPPALSGDLELFHTVDPLLYNAPVLVFYGPAATIGSASTRIQVHVFTPAGLESYTRLAISPSSPFYSAVNALPREEQGDEVCRGIAFGLSRYFSELPNEIKECWAKQASAGKRLASPFGLFSPTHVAVLASRMTKVANPAPVIEDAQRALGEQCMSWLDLDIVLPKGAVRPEKIDNQANSDDLTEVDICNQRYGRYGSLVNAFGERSFLPSSKVKRAPSKATSIGRSQVYRQGQKEMVRKEMCELVDTESSYVQKLTELVQDVALVMRGIKGDAGVPVQSVAERAVQRLFPPSLDRMLEVNAAFLDAIRSVLDETEEDAITEIEQDDATDVPGRSSTDLDGIGVLRFAKCLLDELPKFKEDYPGYMNAHASFPSLLKQITSSSDPAVTDAVGSVGEQRLMSMLIEPVQRLPRYTLYIDTISKQLPVGHAALKPLLKARDIVTDICLADASDMDLVKIEDRLSTLVQGWKSGDAPVGRLIAAIDVCEVSAPYNESSKNQTPGILLLFTDRVSFIERTSTASPTARALQADIEKPASLEIRDPSRPQTPGGLLFCFSCQLSETFFTECHDGRAISMIDRMRASETNNVATAPALFTLQGTYTGKASRLVEEIVKASVEGRFSEVERDGGKWDVRSAVTGPGEISLFAAVFEDCDPKRTRASDIRVVIDPERHTDLKQLSKLGVETMISIFPASDDTCQLLVDSMHGLNTRDKINVSDLATALSRRLASLLQMQLSIKHQVSMRSWICRNENVLRSLDFVGSAAVTKHVPVTTTTTEHERAPRPHSPVKTLSNFLSKSIGPGSAHPLQKKMPSSESVFADAPTLQAALPQVTRPASKDNSRPNSKDHTAMTREPDAREVLPPANPSKKIEETLSTYLLALQARKGNVVGRVVKARASADELAVNELYNSLLEDPNMMVVAAEASVDVLFCAFEKFLNAAWKEFFGPVISQPTMQGIQDRAESMFPIDFETYFRDTFHSMIPSNQRALRGIVKLLAELLDGTGNDGDRGILTAAFAELLVPGDNPYSFVSLVDRFVEDIESLFGEVVSVREVDAISSPHLGHGRSRSVNTGSLTSNASSLRKKFGFGGPAKETEIEPPSKVGSVWRTLSKNNKLERPEFLPVTPRMTVQRAKSTDIDTRLVQGRPGSQDQITALPTFSFERPKPKDHSFINGSPMSTIGEATPGRGTGKKKRRSSLSDLTLLQSATNTPIQSPAGTKTLEAFFARDTQSPSMSLSKATARQSPLRQGSPTRSFPRSRLPMTFLKENTPESPAASNSTSLPRPQFTSKLSEEVAITAHPTILRKDSVSGSGIPSPTHQPARHERASSVQPVRNGLSERPTSGNAQKVKPSGIPEKSEKTSLPAPAASSPTRKLRMQSPQKLRERLQSEQRAMAAGQSTLETEMAKLGDELSSLGPGRMGSIRGARPQPPSTSDFNKRVADLGALVTSTLADLQARSESIQSDLSSSLVVSESKARKLDELYREANAENEALYARFNEELGKVVKAVRGGEGVDELKRRMREGNEERDRLRRENARLKREVLGLRSQLKE